MWTSDHHSFLWNSDHLHSFMWTYNQLTSLWISSIIDPCMQLLKETIPGQGNTSGHTAAEMQYYKQQEKQNCRTALHGYMFFFGGRNWKIWVRLSVFNLFIFSQLYSILPFHFYLPITLGFINTRSYFFKYHIYLNLMYTALLKGLKLKKIFTDSCSAPRFQCVLWFLRPNLAEKCAH